MSNYTKKKKVLFIHHAEGIGGSSISMINLIKYIDKSIFEVKVLLLKSSEVCSLLEDNYIEYSVAPYKFYNKYYHYYPIYKHKKNIFDILYNLYEMLCWLLSRFFFSNKLLDIYEADIIHLNSLVLTDFLHASHKKAITILHLREVINDGFLGLNKKYNRNIINKYCDHIISISYDNAKHLNLLEKTTVIYNHISNISTIDEPNDSYKEEKSVLYLGGANLIKGFDILVKSLEYLDKDIIVYFAGNYPHTKVYGINILKKIKNKKMQQLLRIMRSSANAIEIGIIKDIQTYLKRVCCVVAPASIEHFQRPILESYLMKKPIIVTNICGIDELVEDGKTGIVVPIRCPTELAKGINYICNNSIEREKMGVNGFKKYYSNFIQSFDNINKIYKNTLCNKE